jgi:hypothetical protein
MKRGARRGKRQNGNAIIEFALVVPCLLTLMLGVFSVGLVLTRTVQAGIVARDAGAMFMRYVNFNLTENRNLVVRLANGMGMTTNGGNGVVILSQVMRIGATECSNGGYSSSNCPNFGMDVVIKRVKVGNTALYTTTFGNPDSNLMDAEGEIPQTNYLRETSVRVIGFSSLVNLNPGEFAFVSEAYFSTPEINLPGYRNNTYVYQRNIF